MSLFDLNPVETEQQYNNAALNPIDPTSLNANWYEGIGTGLAAGAKTSYYRQLYQAKKADKDETGAQAAISKIDELKPDPKTVGVAGQLMYGLADTLGTVYGEMMSSGPLPQVLAIESGKTYAASQEQLKLREGLDPETARSVAAIEGAGVGLGLAVPGSLVGGLGMRVASGAGINAVMGAGQRALIQNELAKAGYAEMAKQYAPFDGTQLTTDLVIGGFFGGLLGERPQLKNKPRITGTGNTDMPDVGLNGIITPDQMTEAARMRLAELRVKRDGTEAVTMTGPNGEPVTIPGREKEFLTDDEKNEIAFLEKHDGNAQVLARAYGYGLGNPERIKPSDVDLTLTQNNAAHVELGTAPGVPTDLATRQAHVDMVNQALKDLIEGNPVQASPDVTAGNFMENPAAVATRNEIGEAVRGHLSDLDMLQQKLEERGLPGDTNLYSIQPVELPPLRVTSDVRSMLAKATKENWSSERIIQEMEGLLGKLEDRNAAKSAPNPRVRGALWLQERLTRAERTGELSPEQVALAKWLLSKNPHIGDDLAISLRASKNDQVGGMYNPIARLAVLFKGGGDALTAVHEILHHTERMMPDDVQREIRKAWLAEVKRVRDVAERSGNENLALYINDVIKANLGMQANAENALNAIKQGLVNADAYALYNPSEFWAVKASQIVAERAGESWVQRAVQFVRELMEKAKSLFGLRSDASVIRGLDSVLKAEGYKSAANLTDTFQPNFKSLEGADLEQLLSERSRPADSMMDAERALAAGDAVFVMHDMGDEPTLVSNSDQLKGYTPDQIAIVPREKAQVLYNVEAPGKGVAKENLNGFEPGLRVIVPVGKMKLPEKPLVLTGTNLKNAARQIGAIDDILAKFPDADTSPTEWSKMMAYAMATNDVPVPPYRFLKDINGTGAFNNLSRLTPGQIADADHGFENARLFREAYTSKQLDVETTGKLFLWSFLSRGVSPYVQEGLFIDAFPGIDQWVKKAAAGELTEADFGAYEAWAKSVAPQGSGQPGSGATHNLNAFGKLFLFKMGQKDASGVSLLQKMHDMMEDPNMTGQQIRRWFIQNTEGVGIDNKVVSFTLLVAGFNDVMVLDRVQIRQLWDDGRFGDRNLYDGRKVDGKPVAGSALSEITYGARGLLIYEAIERALAKRVENIYASLGRPQDASIGRYHWETWVADSQQEASHGTLDAILHDAKSDAAKISEVTAKEGEYGAYQYGARYGRDQNGPYFLYTTPTGQEYKFDVPAFREFMQAVKSPANKVVPSGFKVTEAGNAPWYEKPQVNKQALDELAQRYAREPGAGEGAGAVRAPGSGEAVPDLAGRGADPYAPEELMRQAPALTYIGEDGTMVSAATALARADAEITTAQRDAQGFGAAVACALRG